MSESLAEHDRVIRDAIERAGGYVFSTAGDSFAAAFSTPHSACEAAVASQISFSSTDWPGPALRVRMGLDTGVADERDGGYFGSVLNRASRLQEAANSGQILLSAATAIVLRQRLPDDTTIVDLGFHRLRDLAEPEQVYRLDHPLLVESERPIRSVPEGGHNLPVALTSFIGRSRELDSIGPHLSNQRLVTILGPGGIGKTRLAHEFARRNATDYPDGVWFVDLRDQDADSVLAECAQTLGIRAGEGVLTTREALLKALRPKAALVVMDNCEHVIDAVRDLLTELLGVAERVHVLATSRISLRVAGETTIRLEPLATGAADADTETEAVALLIDRARAVRANLTLNDADRRALAHICRRVDGMPLAIELAAARLRVLSPADLLHRLEQSFTVLRDETNPDPRHRAIASVIESSYRSLEPAQRLTFRYLSVFAGGFDLAGAEAVAGTRRRDPGAVLDDIETLADSSLVAVEHRPGSSARFRMLEPIREFAAAELVTSGEYEAIRARHIAHFRDLVGRSFVPLRGPDQRTWDLRLQADEDNIRAMLSGLIERVDYEDHLTACFQLEFHWRHRALQVDALALIDAGLEGADQVPVATQIKALVAASMLANDVLHPSAIGYAQRAHDLAVASDVPGAVARTSIVLGACRTHKTGMTDYVGADLVETGGELFDRDPEPWWWEPAWETAYWTMLRGAYLPPGHPEQQTYESRSIQLARDTGDPALTAFALLVAFRAEPEVVDARLAAAIELGRHHGLRSTLGLGLMYRGAFARLRGDVESAGPMLIEAERLLRDFGGHFSASVANALTVFVDAASDQPRRAEVSLRRLVDRDPPVAIAGHVVAAATVTAVALEQSAAAFRFRDAARDLLASNFIEAAELDKALTGLRRPATEPTERTTISPADARSAVQAWLDELPET